MDTERGGENGPEVSKGSKEAYVQGLQTACPSTSPRVRPLVWHRTVTFSANKFLDLNRIDPDLPVNS